MNEGGAGPTPDAGDEPTPAARGAEPTFAAAGVTVPDWPEGTAAVLATAGDAPRAIPVSTAMRTGERTVHLALGRRRESLARLRADPRCALTVMAGPDRAFTLHGRATVVDEDVAGTVAVRLDVHAVHDHMTSDFTIEDGVQWRWTAEKARERDATVRAGLRRFAGTGA